MSENCDLNEKGIMYVRKVFADSLQFFKPEGMFVMKGKGLLVSGSLPISMPAISLRDKRIIDGTKLYDREILGVETFAHARDYSQGEKIGFLLRMDEI